MPLECVDMDVNLGGQKYPVQISFMINFSNISKLYIYFFKLIKLAFWGSTIFWKDNVKNNVEEKKYKKQ